ncbi:MAG TPA: DUF1674 domain-containing protein [Alphaproteobacteria bacterium]|nr:DUF1674 domain-containing protein [Alphaproteobacteria bacterium]
MNKQDDRASPPPAASQPPQPAAATSSSATSKKIPEIGGPSVPEPTRYGDWERNGRCVDF